MSLHLTKIEIDYETAHHKKLRDSHDWHRWAWEAFPGRPEANRDFLTRLDDTGRGFRFLIQSHSEATRPAQCPEDAFETKPIPDSFLQHSAYRFSLLVNPTVKRVIRDASGTRKKNGRREPISNRDELLGWLARKSAAHGFEVDPRSVQIIPRARQVFTKRSRSDDKRHSGTHTATEFRGILKVTDPSTFTRTVHTGIGSAKAFGFGMLCLSPL